jgi:DNA (cytosine-5)-methyltransferase 1
MAKLRAVDFFCSIGGMTYGFRKAGIDVIAGLDIDPSCKETYEYNNPGTKFIQADIKKYSFEQLEKDAGIKKDDDALIFIGCSPCQYWSIINTDKTKSKKTKNLLTDFQNFVEHFNPGYVVVENVPGILKKAEESGLNKFIKMLDKMGYVVDKDILNANHFGVPQNRRRFSLIASRVNKEIKLPEPQKEKTPTLKDFIGVNNGFEKITHNHKDESDFIHTTARLSDTNLRRIKKTKKNGGSRLDWKNNKELQLDCYIDNDKAFNDIYGRMSWDKPAPTITTKFHSISNGRFGHPEENRAISLREGATLQTFPKKYVFKEKSIGKVAKHIGNAVPPTLAKKIANQFYKKSIEKN